MFKCAAFSGDVNKNIFPPTINYRQYNEYISKDPVIVLTGFGTRDGSFHLSTDVMLINRKNYTKWGLRLLHPNLFELIIPGDKFVPGDDYVIAARFNTTTGRGPWTKVAVTSYPRLSEYSFKLDNDYHYFNDLYQYLVEPLDEPVLINNDHLITNYEIDNYLYKLYPEINVNGIYKEDVSHGSSHSLLLSGDILLVANSTHSNKTIIINMSTDGFRETSHNVVGRYRHRQVTLNDGTVLLIGGVDINTNVSTFVTERYNPYTDIWDTVSNLPNDIRHIEAVKLHNGNVLVTGVNIEGTIPKAYIYSPFRDEWIPINSIGWNIRQNKLVTDIDGDVISIGGLLNNIPTNRVFKYYFKKGTWDEITPLAEPLYNVALSYHGSGQHVICYGNTTTGSDDISSNCYVYN